MGVMKELEVILNLVKEELIPIKNLTSKDIDNAIYFAFIKIFGLKLGYAMYINNSIYWIIRNKINKEVLV